jgi:hypothetical protein
VITDHGPDVDAGAIGYDVSAFVSRTETQLALETVLRRTKADLAATLQPCSSGEHRTPTT